MAPAIPPWYHFAFFLTIGPDFGANAGGDAGVEGGIEGAGWRDGEGELAVARWTATSLPGTDML